MFAKNAFICLFAVSLALASSFAFSAEESLKVSLLPPNPRVKNEAIGFVDYKVSSLDAQNKERIEESFLGIPLGDCPECKRGISLNCKSAHSDKGKKESCGDGLAGGIGLRFETIDPTSKTIEIRIKNGTKYKREVSKVGTSDPLFLTADKPLEIFLTKQDRKVYRIEFSFKPRTVAQP
jgi:hypothetical protein